MTLDLSRYSISEAEILDLLHPYIDTQVQWTSTIGRRLLRERRNGLMHLIAKAYLEQVASRVRKKSPQAVVAHYDDAYLGVTSESFGFGASGRPITCCLGDKVMKLQTSGLTYSAIRVIEKLLLETQAREVCECGSGSGANVLFLGGRQPQLTLRGFDVSDSATTLAKSVLASDEIDFNLVGKPLIIRGEALNDLRNRVQFFQSSAAAIDLPDKCVDVTYTRAALEQIWDLREESFLEIRRITKSYVVFYEPFWDHNSFFEKLFLHSGNYFRLRTADIENYGYKIVKSFNCFPSKPTFRYSLLVAKVV